MSRELTRIVIQPSGDAIVLDQWAELVDDAPLLPTHVGTEHKTHPSLETLPVTHVGLHYGEEPYLCGTGGVVAVYFARCNLRCVDCTDSPTRSVEHMTALELTSLIRKYLDEGGASVSFVSPTLYHQQLLSVFEALFVTHPHVPLIYNCGGYETEASVAAVAPWVDVFLPDFKAVSSAVLLRRRLPQTYADVLVRAMSLMVHKRPLQVRGNQLIRGVVVRHLLLPHDPDELYAVLAALSPFADDILINLMTHYYYPEEHRVMDVRVPPLNRSTLKQFRISIDGVPLNWRMKEGVLLHG